MVTVSSNTADSAAGNKPKLPLRVKKGIKERYDPEVESVLSQIRKQLQDDTFELIPNFEDNYAALAAFDATLDRSDGEDNGKLSEYWLETLGQATLNYFEGFLERLQADGYKTDDIRREAFAEQVTKKAVQLRIVPSSVEVDGRCDCVIEQGTLVIRTTVEHWFESTVRCCDNLDNLL